VTTATEIITSALRFINAYSPGESLASDDSSDALTTLNDMLDSWSTDQASVFASSEDIFTFVGGQYQYTIGNYDAGTFAGTVTNASATITGVTVPADLIARADLTGVGIPAGATVISFNAGAGTILMSAVATASPGAQQIAYTVPGDFKMQRPLRINDSFTRITTQASGLDYPIQMISQERYIEIGFKGISAPWPIVAWYNPTMPLGNIYFYQNPSGAGQLHLFSDDIFTSFTSLTQDVRLPQGYALAIKRSLGRALCPEYGGQWGPDRERLTKESYDMIKSLNQVPVPVSNYDTALVRAGGRDAGWILHGGFR
jgi:hypothetical protein